jgi:hypothetical protein
LREAEYFLSRTQSAVHIPDRAVARYLLYSDPPFVSAIFSEYIALWEGKLGSRALESSSMVTGPSFTRPTCIIAPKTPSERMIEKYKNQKETFDTLRDV